MPSRVNGRRVISTYRLQFSPDFTFREAEKVAPYLRRLGISTIYSSPIFEARTGSGHGYDVTDAGSVRGEFGSEEAFSGLMEKVHAEGLGWLQGIVPNHMAYHTENRFIYDVLKHGRSSRFAFMFDIDWNHHLPALRGRVLAPFLERDYIDCLTGGLIRIALEGEPCLECAGMKFPICPESISEIVSAAEGGGEEALREAAKSINADRGRLNRIISDQNYLLRNWRSASEEINYRRFFAVNGLIGLRMEDPSVFEETHALVRRWIEDGTIDGVRVDHIDGLADPLEYLHRLRKIAEGAYVVVEKILSADEELEPAWPVEGTTGYDFLNASALLFVDRGAEEAMTRIYSTFAGGAVLTEEMRTEAREEVIGRLFAGDIDNLTQRFLQCIRGKEYGSDVTAGRMRAAIGGLLSSLRIYRTYVTEGAASPKDRSILKEAVSRSGARLPWLERENAALSRLIDDAATDAGARSCLVRLQQLSPAIAAKSLEDSIFFRYARFIPLNEVGSDPACFGSDADAFHSFIANRARRFPLSMNCTSTHDTKYGEDARARMHYLSEIHGKWGEMVIAWFREGDGFRTNVGGKTCPSPAEEYYMYQLLAGTCPAGGRGSAGYRKRAERQIIKALREASLNSCWEEPCEEWENGCILFLDSLLDGSNRSFAESFDKFLPEIIFHGSLNSLSLLTLKMLCPGIPDTYQGSEVWNLGMTDPDNRRSIDFEKLSVMLKHIEDRGMDPAFVSEMQSGKDEGLVKMFLTRLLLHMRREDPQLFLEGAYIPLQVSGPLSNHLIAFARVCDVRWLVAAVPRLTAGIAADRAGDIWGNSWEGTNVLLPSDSPASFTNSITGRHLAATHRVDMPVLRAADLLDCFPVGVATGQRRAQSDGQD